MEMLTATSFGDHRRIARTTRCLSASALIIVCALACVKFAQPTGGDAGGTATLRASQPDDSFTIAAPTGCLAEGVEMGAWMVRYTGHGCVRIGHDGGAAQISIAPKAVSSSEQTSAPLILGPYLEGRVRYSVSVTTDHQLRTGSEPNPWEVGWIVWHYADDEHFYYFIPKPNGWELGKRDPAYPGGQRFLATGSSPAFAVGGRYDVDVMQENDRVSIRVDGIRVVTFTDDERPYTAGRLALYSEDAAARFSDIRIDTGGRPGRAASMATVLFTDTGIGR